jgi:hypothetical protein
MWIIESKEQGKTKYFHGFKGAAGAPNREPVFAPVNRLALVYKNELLAEAYASHLKERGLNVAVKQFAR